jgi:hypothetical protein
MTIKLTDDTVTQIRTASLTDTYWARLLGTTVLTIRSARCGITYRDVTTPPDVRPRKGTGRGRKSDANLARVRRGCLDGC